MFTVSVEEIRGHARSTTSLRDRVDGCGRLLDRGRPPGDAFGRLGSPILAPVFAHAAEAAAGLVADAAGRLGGTASALVDTAALYDDTDTANGERFAKLGSGGPPVVHAPAATPPSAPPDPLGPAESTYRAIQQCGWAEGLLSGGIRAADPDAPVDLFSSLTSGVVAWLFDPARKLGEYLGLLTVHSVGGPAAAWAELADELTAIAREQARLATAELPTWRGQASDAYRASVGRDVRTTTALAVRVRGVHLGMLGADSVIADVRRAVRGMISDAVDELLSVALRWAPMMAVTPGAVPFGAMAEARTVVARWSSRISAKLAKLKQALGNLGGLVGHSLVGAPVVPVAGAVDPKMQAPLKNPGHDAGAGAFGSKTSTLQDMGAELGLYQMAGAAEVMGHTDAARHLRHYLDGSGTDLVVDPGKIMQDVPSFQGRVDRTVGDEVSRIAAESAAAGKYGTKVPFHTDWESHYNTKSETPNWFYAIGGMQYSTTGFVTTYPPTTPGGQPRVEVEYRVDVYDRYNWDGGKSVTIGGHTVTDEFMGELHRTGLAKEYDVVGSSETFSYTGEAPAPSKPANLETPDSFRGTRTDPNRHRN